MTSAKSSVVSEALSPEQNSKYARRHLPTPLTACGGRVTLTVPAPTVAEQRAHVPSAWSTHRRASWHVGVYVAPSTVSDAVIFWVCVSPLRTVTRCGTVPGRLRMSSAIAWLIIPWPPAP